MRWLLRSAFWLCLAYVVIKPGVDLAEVGTNLSTTAVSAGQQIVADGVERIACTTLECAGGKALLSGALAATTPPVSPTVAAPPASAALAGVPLPRPRPSRG